MAHKYHVKFPASPAHPHTTWVGDKTLVRIARIGATRVLEMTEQLARRGIDHGSHDSDGSGGVVARLAGKIFPHFSTMPKHSSLEKLRWRCHCCTRL